MISYNAVCAYDKREISYFAHVFSTRVVVSLYLQTTVFR